MVGKDGRQYENRLVGEINDRTGPNVRAIPSGYSGNHSGVAEDFIITTKDGNFSVELKKTAQDTFTIPTDDLEQIRACGNIHTHPCIALKYSHRELMVTSFGPEGGEDGRESEDSSTSLASSHGGDDVVADTPSAFNPRYGRTGTFITDRPSLDNWNSSRSGMDDTDVLLGALGISSDVGVETDVDGFNISETTA